MEHVNSLLADPRSTMTTQAGSTASRTPARTDAEFVNQLFRQLQGIFPAWKAAFPDAAAFSEAKRQWTMALVEAGMTDPEKIKSGLSYARQTRSPFIPSVGQFIGWCNQADMDRLAIPSEATVMAQMVNYSAFRSARHGGPAPEIHFLSYWIYQNIDLHLWREARNELAKKMVHELYLEALRLVERGHEFPEPPVLIGEVPLSDNPRTAEQKAAAEKAMADLRAAMSIN